MAEFCIVMHFDDPNEGLSDLYFIDPRWLCSLMARVVTVKSHADLVKEGILEIEETKMLFISDVLPFDFAPQYIRLLVRFQVAYRLDKSRILVPSKLPENEPKEVKNMLLPFVPVRRVYKIDYQRIHGFWTRFMSRFLFYVKEMIGVDPTRYQKSKDTEHGFSANFCRACVRVENSSRQCPCFAYTAEWTEKETTEKKSKSSPSASAKNSPKPSMRSSRPPTNRSSAKQTPKKKLPVDDELQALFLDPTVKLFTEAELADDDDVDAVVINNVNTAMMYNRSPSSLAKKKKESVKKIHVGIRVPSYDGSTIYRAKKSNSTPSRSSQNARAAADEDRPQKDCEEQSSFEKADPAKEMNPCDDNEIPRNETPGQEGEVGSEKEPIIGNSDVHKTSSASAASFTSDQTDGYLSDSERCNDSSLSSRTNSVSESSSSFRSPTNSFLGSDPLPEIGNVYSSDFKRDSCCYNDSRIPGRMSTTESFTSEDQTDLDDESSVRSDLSFSQSIDHPAVSLPPGIHSRANSTESKTSDENGYHVDTVADANAAEPRFVGTDTTDDIAVDDDEAAIAKDCLADPEEDVSRNQNDISAMDMSNSECHLAGATVNVTDKSDVPLLTGDVINTVDEVTNENATISSVRAKFDGNIKDDGADDGTHDVMDGANTEMDDSPNECNEVLSDESNANFDHQFTKTLENSDTYPSSSCNSYVGSHDNKNHCPCQEPNAANNLEKTCHASTNNSTLGMSDPEGIDPETGLQAIDVATEKCTLCKEIVALDEMVTIPLDVAELIEKKFLQCWRSGICLNHPELFIAVAHHPLSDTIVVESAVSPSPLGRRLLTFVVDHLDTLIKEWYPGLLLSFGAEPTVQKLIPCRVCEKNGIPRPHRFTFDSCVTQCSMGNFVRCPRHEVSIQDIAPDVVLQDIDSDLLLEEDEIEYENTDVNKIGDGSFGKVYRGRCRDKDAAIKEYSTAITEEDALKRYCEVRRELNILRCVGQHPFLVNLIGVCLRPFRLVLELALEGSLAMTLFNPSFLMDRVVVFRMIYQVANALNFLHGLNVIYRDLKPENVLVMSYAERDDVNIKLTDFGTATFQFAEGLHAVEGTPGYHAPEMLEEFSKRTGYDEKVDVFSLAMLMYGFITRRRPFFSVNSSAEINHLVSLGRQPEYDDVMVARIGLASLTWLMEKCMQYEPYMRPNSGVVAAQLRSPAFQIFLGLIALPCPQSVRHVVFVEGTRELWVAVDDKATNLVLVYELEKIRLKKKFTINRVSRKDLPLCMQVNCMHVATTDVLIGLRGDHDVVTLHDIVTYELKARIVLLEPVFCLSSNDDYIFLGMSSGAFRIVPIANNGEARTVEVSHTDPINCMVAVDKFLWLMVAKCIQIFYTEEVDSVRAFELNSVRFSSSTSSFSQAILSMDKKAVWCVSKGDSIVTGWDVDTRQKICDIDCKSVLSQVSSEDEPVTAVDAIVTCIQVVFDTVWIGTGGGMVLILDAQSGELITWMHLFDDHVRTLTLILGPGPCSTEKCYVVASGKNVLESALSRGGKVVCRLAEDVIKPAPTVQSPTKGLERSKTKTRTNSLSKSRTSPFHRASPSSKNRTSPSSKYRTSPKSPMSDGTGPDAEDGGVNSRTTGGVLLFFEGLPAEVLRRIEARS